MDERSKEISTHLATEDLSLAEFIEFRRYVDKCLESLDVLWGLPSSSRVPPVFQIDNVQDSSIDQRREYALKELVFFRDEYLKQFKSLFDPLPTTTTTIDPLPTTATTIDILPIDLLQTVLENLITCINITHDIMFTEPGGHKSVADDYFCGGKLFSQPMNVAGTVPEAYNSSL